MDDIHKQNKLSYILNEELPSSYGMGGSVHDDAIVFSQHIGTFASIEIEINFQLYK